MKMFATGLFVVQAIVVLLVRFTIILRPDLEVEAIARGYGAIGIIALVGALVFLFSYIPSSKR